ncbi:T9SS type A sorting domain-containing protein [bacterium]|nr:T9SS type A sorting domain-containing protein [bacterium]
MKRPLVPAILLSFALLLPAGANAAVTWTQTTRNIGSEAILTNTGEFAIDSDSQASNTIGAFSALAIADTMVTSVLGSSSSQQTSDLFLSGFAGTGSFTTTTDVTDPEGFADVFGRSVFNGYFDLDTPTSYTLTGFVTNGGNGTSAAMYLYGPNGPIVNVQALSGTTIPVDETGMLAPGSYLVSVSAAGNAQNSPPDLLTEASGEWQMSFFLGGATDAPATAPVAGLRIFPNPARGSATISLATRSHAPALLRVHDAAGRIIRSLDAASGSSTWDTRDAAGRPVPAGVYFVTVQRDGRLETGRVTVLR